MQVNYTKKLLTTLCALSLLYASPLLASKTGFSLFRYNVKQEGSFSLLSSKLLQINADVIYLEGVENSTKFESALDGNYDHFYFVSETGTLVASKYALKDPKSAFLPKDRGSFLDFVLLDEEKELGHLYFAEGSIETSDLEEAVREMRADSKENIKVPHTLSLPLEKELLILKDASKNRYDIIGMELPLLGENTGILTAVRKSTGSTDGEIFLCANKEKEEEKEKTPKNYFQIEGGGTTKSGPYVEGSVGKQYKNKDGSEITFFGKGGIKKDDRGKTEGYVGGGVRYDFPPKKPSEKKEP